MTTFTDPHLAVYSSTLVRDGTPVLLVFHDEDGVWQFLSSEETLSEQSLRVHIGHLLDRDLTLHEVAALPLGWKAWRWSVGEPWVREPIPEDQAEF
ncbi:MAG TPA: hypothetical protein VFA43_21035 [Gemmatimonadaceae bacterium]|nr:hypothetical protein [Gemmatimonadaceae bacterium]